MRGLIVSCMAVALLVLAVAGIWAQAFRDNVLQWAGLWALVVAMVAVFVPSVPELRELGLVDAIQYRAGDLNDRDVLAMAAFLLFALGTAVKVWRHRHPKAPQPPAQPPAPYKIEPTDMRRVAGGGGQQ